MITRAAFAFATTHHGLLRRSDADRLGISARAWYRELDAGRLLLLHPGVARAAGAPRTRHQRVLAAVWACGSGAVASHRTSAWLWGVPRADDEPIDVISGREARFARCAVVVHRPRDRDELRPVHRGAIPTTSPLRMLVDLGAVDSRGVFDAMEHILVSRTASPPAVLAALDRHARQGRHGVRALREAIARYPFARDVADSALERQMLDLAARYGLPSLEFHAIVEGYEVDFLVAGTRVALECDGRRWHEYAFENDRRRDQALLAAGWIVVRFTWRQVTLEPGSVARRIRQVLEAFGHLPPPASGGVP
jgi:very-short-patch-repair endonuclease